MEEEEEDLAYILGLSDDLLRPLIQGEAQASGTLHVLLKLAATCSRFRKLVCGESSKLFDEPLFVPRGGECTILQVAAFAAKYGSRFRRLHLGSVAFDPKRALPAAAADTSESVSVSSAAQGDAAAASSSSNTSAPACAAAAAAAGPAPAAAADARGTLNSEPTWRYLSLAPPEIQDLVARADGALCAVLRSCPNLTHLSLFCAHDSLWCLDALADLPDDFSLPHLRHLDLSGLLVPLPALRRILAACCGTLERLYLRGTFVIVQRLKGLRDDLRLRKTFRGVRAMFSIPRGAYLRDPLLRALEGLTFPRLVSLDLAGSLAGMDGLCDLVPRCPALRDLYLNVNWVESSLWGPHGKVREEYEEYAAFAPHFRRPGRLVITKSLDSAVAEWLRDLRKHFDASVYPRSEENRVDVPRLALAAVFEEVSGGKLDVARRLVNNLGVPPLSRLRRIDSSLAPWIPPFFSSSVEGPEGATVLHALAETSLTQPQALQLVEEWGLETLKNSRLEDGSGCTPLHLSAMRKRCLPAMRALLQLGADPVLKDEDGETPLHLACTLAHVEQASALMARGGLQLLLAKDSEGQNALQLLAQRGSEAGESEVGRRVRLHRQSLIAVRAVEVLGLGGPQLAEAGVQRSFLEEPVWGTGGDEYLLHFAAAESCGAPAVAALLRAGASPQLPNFDGKTLLQSVRGRGGYGRALEAAVLQWAAGRGVPPESLLESLPRPAKMPRLA
eukprot:tig00020629_g12402.t1